jgi:hypothetical protein
LALVKLTVVRAWLALENTASASPPVGRTSRDDMDSAVPSSAEPKPKRRWFQCRLPTLVILLMSVIVCSWLVMRMWRDVRSRVSGVVTIDALTIELPPGSRLRFDQGFDTEVGEVTSGGTQHTLKFDIGFLAGNAATDEMYVRFKWQKHEKIDGMQMDYALASRNGKDLLIVSFPSLGPANFWTPVENDDDVEAILKVMRTVRPLQK